MTNDELRDYIKYLLEFRQYLETIPALKIKNLSLLDKEGAKYGILLNSQRGLKSPPDNSDIWVLEAYAQTSAYTSKLVGKQKAILLKVVNGEMFRFLREYRNEFVGPENGSDIIRIVESYNLKEDEGFNLDVYDMVENIVILPF